MTFGPRGPSGSPGLRGHVALPASGSRSTRGALVACPARGGPGVNLGLGVLLARGAGPSGSLGLAADTPGAHTRACRRWAACLVGPRRAVRPANATSLGPAAYRCDGHRLAAAPHTVRWGLIPGLSCPPRGDAPTPRMRGRARTAALSMLAWDPAVVNQRRYTAAYVRARRATIKAPGCSAADSPTLTDAGTTHLHGRF